MCCYVCVLGKMMIDLVIVKLQENTLSNIFLNVELLHCLSTHDSLIISSFCFMTDIQTETF